VGLLSPIGLQVVPLPLLLHGAVAVCDLKLGAAMASTPLFIYKYLILLIFLLIFIQAI